MSQAAELIFEPLGDWPREPTAEPRPSNFRATYKETLKFLARELRMVGADRAVIQVDVSRNRIRKDGHMPYNTRTRTPAVAVTFEVPEEGPTTLRTDEYDHWHDNLRGIALSMEAYRVPERHGVARNREHYRGFPALEAPLGGRLASYETIVGYSGLTREQADAMGSSRVTRLALKRTHPDKPGGSRAAYDEVMGAKAVLGI